MNFIEEIGIYERRERAAGALGAKVPLYGVWGRVFHAPAGQRGVNIYIELTDPHFRDEASARVAMRGIAQHIPGADVNEMPGARTLQTERSHG